MATKRSLGTLTIDLIAETSGFTQGMDKASRKAKASSDQIWGAVEKVRLATVALGVAGGVAAAAWVTSMTKMGEEIGRLSKLSGASAEEFQKMAYAAKTVGIEQDKLSDILKDVNDKVGDFLVTGGGPMLDFFEQIAPKIGVTADQFRGLSGPEALGLYVSSLEKAGVSQAEMTFFMEALANDATLLIPLMEDNASAMKSLGDEAQRLGVVMSNDAVAASKELDLNLNRLQAMASGLSITLANQLLPRINDFVEYAIEAATETDGLHTELTDLVNDAAIPGWIDALGVGLARVADVAVAMGKTIAAVHGSFKAVSADVNLASKRYGLGMDMTWATSQVFEGVEEDTEALSRALDERNKVVEDANQAWIDLWEYDGNRFEQAWMKATEKAQFDRDFIGPNRPTALDSITVSGVGTGGSGSEKSKISEGERYINSLKRQLETVAKLTEVETLRNRMAEGSLTFATQALEDQAIAYAQTIDFIKDQEEAYKLLEESRKEFAAGLADAPAFGGIDALIGGASGELLKTGEAAEELQEWYEGQLSAQLEFLEQGVINEQEYADRIYDINKTNEERLASLNANSRSATLSLFADMTGQTAELLETMGKKGSAAYKVLFFASKAAAIAQAIVNTEEAATKALTLGPILGIPASTLIRVTGYASVATMAATTIAGMAHDGIDSVPEDGTWLLQRGERVTTAETSAKLDSTLERLNNDMNRGRGNGTVVNLIENRDRAGEVDTRYDDEQEVLDVFVADIRSGGRASQTIERTYGLARVGR